MKTTSALTAFLFALLICVSSARAVVTFGWVTVGNPGNAADISGDGAGGYGDGEPAIVGRVRYTYRISKYEVTAGQYTEFLNAVARSDPYGLYNADMQAEYGCQIERLGSDGSYTYQVAADWQDRPVNYVSWGDAARFSNWLHNGQPTGAQESNTTEDGAYRLDGATSSTALLAVRRELDATYVIPSESEWYKAAYHKNDGVTGNYFDYPTSSDAPPMNDVVEPDPGNNANFQSLLSGGRFSIGPPFWRTEVGEFENSASPYGTFDQGGNVWEWNESILYGRFRGVRGGAYFGNSVLFLHAGSRTTAYNPTFDIDNVGFRVASVPPFSGVPEPASPTLLLCMAAAALTLSTGRKQGLWRGAHRRGSIGRTAK